MTITCSKCDETKSESAFDLRADTGERRRTCRSCRREYQRQRLSRADRTTTRSRRLVGSSELYRCTTCGQMRPEAEFNRRARGSLFLQSWCRDCFSKYKIDRYLKNRTREIARAHRNSERARSVRRHFLRDYLATHPCVNCGERDPAVLEFDHLRDKLMDVTRMAHAGWSFDAIQKEIAKCEVRCANCHRRKTRERYAASKTERALQDSATPTGLEPAAPTSVAWCSIH